MRQTCGQRSDISAACKRRALAFYFPIQICCMLLISKYRGELDLGLCMTSGFVKRMLWHTAHSWFSNVFGRKIRWKVSTAAARRDSGDSGSRRMDVMSMISNNVADEPRLVSSSGMEVLAMHTNSCGWQCSGKQSPFSILGIDQVALEPTRVLAEVEARVLQLW